MKNFEKSSILDASYCHRKIVSFLKKGWNECTKLCASRAFVSYVPYVLYMPYMPKWFTCSRTLRVCVPSCLLTCLLFFTCSMCLHYFKCFHFIRAFIFYVLCVPSFCYMPYVPAILHVHYVPSSFWVPCMTSCFTYFTCFHFLAKHFQFLPCPICLHLFL